MRKLFTLALAVLASASMWAAEAAGVGTYSVDGKKPGNTNRFYKLGNGAYIHRQNNSSWTDGLGMKLTADNQNGVAIYVNNSMKITALVKKKENKNASSVSFNVYSITDGATVFEALETGTDNKTEVTIEYDATPIATFGTSFDALENKASEEKSTDEANLTAGYYYIVGADDGVGICFLYSITLAAGCEAPGTALSLKLDTTKSEGSGLYAGDKITFTISGGNGAETSMTLDGAAFAGTEWTATEGEHTFVLSQDVKDGVCGNEIEVKLNVASKTPVSAATVSGPSGTYLDKETTLTCEAENATDYQWYKGGTKIDGATSAEYSFTPDAVGDLVFYCEAWNKFNNGTPVKSADFTVTVTEGVCGILIKASRTGSQVATVDAESVVGGTAETTMTSDKLDKKNMFGVTLADGTFKEGDKFMMNIIGAADVAGSLKLYSDKGGSDLICEITENIDGTGLKQWALPAAINGKNSLYVVRGNVTDWNAKFNYIAVKRPCGEESSDATLKSLTVGEDEIELIEGTFDYEYEVPAKYKADDELVITFELNNAKAVADKTSGYKILVTDGMNKTETIAVTAEDGTKATYTITITKPEEAKSDDASIKELKIENEVITAVNDTFSYEVPAEANLSDASVEFVLNHENATASKKSPFLVKVPASGEAATEEELVVTAEDEITIKTYIISVSRAAEEQGLWDVQGDKVQSTKVLRDGQMYILRGEKTYTIVGAEMK